MAEKTLLLISTAPDEIAFAEAAAKMSELSFSSLPAIGDAIEILRDKPPGAVVVGLHSEADYQTYERAIQETIGIFSETLSSNRMHYISSLDIDKLPFLLKSPLFGHLIYKNFADPNDAGTRYGRIIKATLADRAFGLASFLKPGVKVQTVQLTSSAQKNEAVEAVKGYLVSAKFHSRMAAVVSNAVDELLLNAIFDAATDDLGKPLYNRTARSTLIKLEGKAAVEMQLAFDGEQIAVSVTDHFGSLDRERLLTHLSKFYGDKEYQVKSTTAGAGLGLATVFRSGASLFFASEMGSKTECTLFFRKTASYKDFRDQFRFLSTQFYF